MTQTAYPLSGLWRGTHRKINEDTLMAHAWDEAVDKLEPVTSQSDEAHPIGL